MFFKVNLCCFDVFKGEFMLSPRYFLGEFMKGFMHNLGVLTKADGKKILQTWEMGVLKKEVEGLSHDCVLLSNLQQSCFAYFVDPVSILEFEDRYHGICLCLLFRFSLC